MSDYKRNPRGARRARKSLSRKALVVLSLMMVLAVAAVGGTVAWLTDSTDDVVNTFTVGNINIDLTETENLNLKMVPGNTITKDPVVTVEANSEACWLFVKVDESANLDDFISYDVATGWTALAGEAGVYYREVLASSADQEFSVLAGDTVTVKETVTKAMMDAITKGTASAPTLTFTAYACQYVGANGVAFTADEAWANLGV